MESKTKNAKKSKHICLQSKIFTDERAHNTLQGIKRRFKKWLLTRWNLNQC